MGYLWGQGVGDEIEEDLEWLAGLEIWTLFSIHVELKISGIGKWQEEGDILRRLTWEQSTEQMWE